MAKVGIRDSRYRTRQLLSCCTIASWRVPIWICQVRYFPFITTFLCFNYGISIWLPGSGLRTVRFLMFHSSIALLRNYFSMRTFTHSLVGHYPVKPRLLHTHSNSVFPTTPLTNPPLSPPMFITLLVSGQQLEFRWNPTGRASSWRRGRWSSGGGRVERNTNLTIGEARVSSFPLG